MYDLQIVGLAYDPESNRVFWGTNGRIQEAKTVPNAVPRILLNHGKC